MNGSMNLGICYKKDSASDDMLMVLSDNDYANDQAYRRSTYGYVFILSGGEVVWSSKKQPMVSLSITKTEFISAAHCAY